MTIGCPEFDGDSHTRKANWFGMTRSDGAPIAMTGKSAPRHRTTERYRAAQGKNDYTFLVHDLSAATRRQFAALPDKTVTLLL